MANSVLSEWSGSELRYVSPAQVVKSFGYKTVAERTPEAYEYRKRSVERVALADGEVAPKRTNYPSPEVARSEVKTKALDLGANIVGVTHVDPQHVYWGEDVSHQYAIMIAVAMDFDEVVQSPNMASGAETLRIYDVTGQIATELAHFIRDRGHSARAHTMKSEQINMLPHAYAAGLGELGKHGSLINRDLGCSFRVSAVTTNLPLAVDAPRPEGIDDICSKCRMCVNYCPGDAISHDKQQVRGVLKWVIDTGACAPYWGSYYACGICIAVCPFNAKAFDRRFKDRYVETIKSIDLVSWRTELKNGLQKPWTHVQQPDSFTEGWRVRVQDKASA